MSEADREPEASVVRLSAIAQIGIVTADLERAIGAWSNRYGVGPWRVREFGPDNVADQVPRPFSMRLATARVGTVDLELIQPLDEASDYARSLGRHDGADHMHHMLFRTVDFAAAIDGFARAGVEQAMAGTTDGARFVYFDTERELGTRIELLGPADRLGPEG